MSNQGNLHTPNRIIKGIGANAYGQVVVGIIQLVGVPIFLRYWGTQLYGEWLTITAVPTYLSMVDLGFSLSAANDMTGRVARGDKLGALAVFQSLCALVGTIILIGLFLCAILIPILPFSNWLQITLISRTETNWVLWLLSASVLIHLFDGVLHAGFRSYGEYAVHSFLNFTTLLFQQLVLWLSVMRGYGPVQSAFSMLIVRVLGTSLVTLWLFMRHQNIKPGFKFASFKKLRPLLKPSIANTAMPLAQGLNIQGFVIVIGMAMGPVAVVTFSTLRTLTRVAVQIVLSISHAFEPELAAAWGRDDNNTLLRLYLTNLRLGFWTALVVVVSLFFLGDWIVNIWTHGKVLMDGVLFVFLLISALMSVFWYGALNLLKAANLHFRASILFVILSLIAVLLVSFQLRISETLYNAGMILVVMDLMMAVFVFKSVSHAISVSAKKVFQSMINFRLFIRDIYPFLDHIKLGRNV